MSLATTVRALVAAGATNEMILAVVEADEAERNLAVTEKRQKDAERQRRHRMSRDVTVTPRDTRDPYPQSEELFSSSLPTEPNQTPTQPPIVPRPSKNSFAEFWLAYPNKVGKRKAEEAHQRAMKRATHTEIMDGLDRSKVHWERNADWLNICNPTTWLNGDRWHDEPDQSARAPPITAGMIAAAEEKLGFRWALEELNGGRTNGDRIGDHGAGRALPAPSAFGR